MLNRRSFLSFATAGAAAATLPVALSGMAHAEDKTRPAPHMMPIPADAPNVAILIHPGMVALDLVGPLTVLTILRCRIFLVWKDKSPIATELGFSVPPTHTFNECPNDLDVLLVPGGTIGTIAYMNDPVVIDFLADRGSRAKWVSAFCTGSITLAASGLLNGYDATGYWALTRFLPLMGARHVDQRVVVDRNRITAGGTTAGIDCALVIATKLKDEEAARRVALILEYSPQPPFHNGTPAEAGPERTQKALEHRKGRDAEVEREAMLAGQRLGI
ncbi:thiamine biosynthesis protein ThiJ [Thalassospira marina]|uniref:Thiamine biosynthesis protein ThiJ n=2 Tax=Thalassospira marina TaxID=2048283 RepID=A0ABM6QE29_9PROT|nr:thiamine biosynthesis protein ThiJ [Thalassospira marina]